MDGIEIRYAGVLLGRATQVRDQTPDGLFVGFAEPLPVGTPVGLKGGEGERTGRVSAVVESADPTVAGMRVQYGDAAARLASAPPAPPPAAAAPVAVPETSGSSGHHADGDNGSAPHEGDHGGRRKRRRR